MAPPSRLSLSTALSRYSLAAFLLLLCFASAAVLHTGKSADTAFGKLSLAIGVAAVAWGFHRWGELRFPALAEGTPWGLLPVMWAVLSLIVYWPQGLPDPERLVSVLLLALVVGCSEELAFRHVLHGLLRPASPRLFLILNPILYGLFHWSGSEFGGILLAVFVGVAFDIARSRGATLATLMSCHVAIVLFSHMGNPMVSHAHALICLGAWGILACWIFMMFPGPWVAQAPKVARVARPPR